MSLIKTSPKIHNLLIANKRELSTGEWASAIDTKSTTITNYFKPDCGKSIPELTLENIAKHGQQPVFIFESDGDCRERKRTHHRVQNGLELKNLLNDSESLTVGYLNEPNTQATIAKQITMAKELDTFLKRKIRSTHETLEQQTKQAQEDFSFIKEFCAKYDEHIYARTSYEASAEWEYEPDDINLKGEILDFTTTTYVTTQRVLHLHISPVKEDYAMIATDKYTLKEQREIKNYYLDWAEYYISKASEKRNKKPPEKLKKEENIVNFQKKRD